MDNSTINFNSTITVNPDFSIGGIIFCLIIRPLTAFLGLFPNGATLVLLLKAKMWDSTDILFFSLTCTDLVSLILDSLDSAFNILLFLKYKNSAEKIFERFYPKTVILYGNLLQASLSKPLIPLISAQRCSAVNRPLTFRQTWTKRKTTIFIMLLTAITTVFGIADVIILALRDGIVFDDFYGTHELSVPIDTSSWVYMIFEGTVVVSELIIYILPIPLTIGFNIGTIIGIRQSRQAINGMDATTARSIVKEIELTKLLLVISTMFLVFNVPFFVALLIHSNRYDTFHVIMNPQSEVLDVAHDIARYLVTLNMAINCVVFVIRSSRYKAAFVEMITCGLRKQS